MEHLAQAIDQIKVSALLALAPFVRGIGEAESIVDGLLMVQEMQAALQRQTAITLDAAGLEGVFLADWHKFFPSIPVQ